MQECRDESDIYNYQQIQVIQTNGINIYLFIIILIIITIISACSADKPFGITQPFEPETCLTNQTLLHYLRVPLHSQMVISNSLCFLFIKMHDNFNVWRWHLLYGNLIHGIAE